jgi:glycosidase
MGMKIIIDWVANHTSPDNIWVKEHPEFYVKDDKGKFVPPVPDWSDVIDLDYNNKAMRIAMIDAMNFWLKETDIDGFRCDVAEMVPTDFWIDCRTELDKTKKIFFLAEGGIPELHKAFDMTYSWNVYHAFKGFFKKEKNIDEVKFLNSVKRAMKERTSIGVIFAWDNIDGDNVRWEDLVTVLEKYIKEPEPAVVMEEKSQLEDSSATDKMSKANGYFSKN